MVTVFSVAAAVRLHRITEIYETHIDEVTYAAVSRSVADNEGLQVNGGPFHLHPPGVFVMMSALIRLGGVESSRLALVEQLRPVEAVVGALTCVVVAQLVLRVSGSTAGWFSGLSLALDPFANRWDSRVFLEAPAMLFTVTAISCLVAAASQTRPRGRLLVGAGLAVGAAVLCKEPYVLATAAPVFILLVLGSAVRRRDALTILSTAACSYVGYVVTIVIAGDWSPWWREKLSGVLRLLGLQQETGFNAPNAEPLTGQLVTNVLAFGPSYGVVVAGSVSAAALLLIAAPPRRATGKHPLHHLRNALDLHLLVSLRPGTGKTRSALRVLGVWQLTATTYLAYAVLFGTLEEQTFYLVLAPSVAAIGCMLGQLMPRLAWRRAALAVLPILLIVAQAASTVSAHQRTDDGYQRMDVWFAREVPEGAAVAVTEDTAQFLLSNLDLSDAGTVPQIVARRTDLVVVSTTLAERGYGAATSGLITQLESRARLVFCAEGRTLGQLRVYDVRALTSGSGRATEAAWAELPERSCG